MYRKIKFRLVWGLVCILLSGCGNNNAQTLSATVGITPTIAVTASPADNLKNLKALNTGLTAVTEQLKADDFEAAKTAFKSFFDQWEDLEEYTKTNFKGQYRQVEDRMEKLSRKFFAETKPATADLLPLVANLQTAYNDLVKIAEAKS